MYLLDTNHCSRLIFGDLNIIQKVEEIGEESISTIFIRKLALIDQDILTSSPCIPRLI
jgi:predicted nucleic acid-binding protein